MYFAKISLIYIYMQKFFWDMDFWDLTAALSDDILSKPL